MFHIPITAFVYVFNIAMFLLGAWVLGKAFALTTILSTFEYPFFLSILQLLSSRVGPLTDDMMLATLFAGAGIGIGLGLVIPVSYTHLKEGEPVSLAFLKELRKKYPNVPVYTDEEIMAGGIEHDWRRTQECGCSSK